jgi:hypothetical protein
LAAIGNNAVACSAWIAKHFYIEMCCRRLCPDLR